ncbi:MAG: patatin-like phospholipase family protein [Pyrinomonadaceae bacterium]
MSESAPSVSTALDIETGTSATPKKQRPKGVGLCLSGGGYRAALFHLGTMRCLHDMGILQTVETVSSVSGGSIVSAYLARRLIELEKTGGLSFDNWETDVAVGFRKFVRNDIRTVPILVHVLWNWIAPERRAQHLERNYRRKLTSRKGKKGEAEILLEQLPDKPDFIFCSTDLTFGVNWLYGRTRVGDYQIGYTPAAGWTLANAVTASSSFPPVFGPLQIKIDPDQFKNGKYEGSDRESLVSRIQLTDGGVYDNFGLEPIDQNHRTIIISDGGAPFGFVRSSWFVSRILRYTTVIMRQVGALRKEFFHTGLTKGWHKGVYLGIGDVIEDESTDGLEYYSVDTTQRLIMTIRTDLDRFSEEEARILENHGYFVTHHKIMTRCAELVPNRAYQPMIPHADWTSDKVVQTALKDSGKRLQFRRIALTIGEYLGNSREKVI